MAQLAWLHVEVYPAGLRVELPAACRQCVRLALAAPPPSTAFVACINTEYLARSLGAELWPPQTRVPTSPAHGTRSRAVPGQADQEEGEGGSRGRRALHVTVTIAEIKSVAREGGDISAFTLLGRYRCSPQLTHL